MNDTRKYTIADCKQSWKFDGNLKNSATPLKYVLDDIEFAFKHKNITATQKDKLENYAYDRYPRYRSNLYFQKRDTK